MKHFINLKDIPKKDLRKIIIDAKKRKNLRKKLSTLEVDKGAPLKGKVLIQMFEKASSRTRISFYLAIKQLGGGTLTLRSNELHLGQGGESIADTAKILSTYVSGIKLGGESKYNNEIIEKPIINATGDDCTEGKINLICQLILKLQFLWIIIFVLIYFIISSLI